MSREKKETAVFYGSDLVNEHGARPALEDLLQQATSRPRPFDVVIVHSPEYLGTPEDIKIVRTRLAEHGVRLEFVHASMEDTP